MIWVALLTIIVATIPACVLSSMLDHRAHDALLAEWREGQAPGWLDHVDAKAAAYAPGSGNLTGY